NSTKKITLGDLFNEFFASIISYDSKLRKTLASLIFKPGKISKDYVLGKRLTYTNPFRFFLSIAIIYFILISFSNDLSDLDRIDNKNKINSFNFQDNSKIEWDKLSDDEAIQAKEFLKGINELNKKIMIQLE